MKRSEQMQPAAPNGVRLIIAGSRGIKDFDVLESALSDPEFQIAEIVSGGAAGVDEMGEALARHYGFPVRRFPADWKQFGKSAGVARNIEMAKYADRLLAIWDGESRGTKHMIDTMRMYGKPVQVVTVKPKSIRPKQPLLRRAQIYGELPRSVPR